ncbi:hypothetical protein GCM10022295_93560 [Streptomyces osmaniensis]|uniref:RES domain-containing protein n=1 Tax=Streptomyces osmaniensis TaxID=593134 RepID=A0ABP6Z7I6_9ACTN
MAVPPKVGGSPLRLAAARGTALVDGHRVLYAASGPNRDDVFRRTLSAKTSGDKTAVRPSNVQLRDRP